MRSWSGHQLVLYRGWTNFRDRGALMNRRCALGLCAVALVTIPAFPSSSVAQGKSLKDQLVGTWIYVSSTGKREDGSAVPRPSAQGAVTYTADGRFHFITVRTEVPKYASGDPARTPPSPKRASADLPTHAGCPCSQESPGREAGGFRTRPTPRHARKSYALSWPSLKASRLTPSLPN